MSGAPAPRIALQGELGSFSDEAIQQLWGSDAERRPFREFAEVTAAVLAREADIGILPIENSIVGSVAGSHDAIADAAALVGIAETVVAVHHCILAAPGTPFESIKSVLSHPVALAQCGHFFAANPQLDSHAVYDTAGAAMDVARTADPTIAALASRRAAHHYHLDVVRADVEDRNDNQTRFIAVARSAVVLERGTPARTMMILRTSDHPGDLLKSLTPFSVHGVNLRRLDARPAGEPWSYRFFVEFDHEAGDTHAADAIRDVFAASAEARLVGTYPRWNPGRRGSIGWRTPTSTGIPR